MPSRLPTLAQAIAFDPQAVDRLRHDRRRIAVVGAGGWIGRALLAGLFDALGEGEARRRIVCFGSSERAIDFGEGRTIGQRELTRIAELPAEPTLVFHLAFLTKDKVAGMAEDDYVEANRVLSQTVYDNLEAIGADRLFVASSGAAAFADAEGAAHDLRLYGRLKRDDEDLFAGWAEAGPGRRAAIVRIFNVSGPFINKHDTYALASFILDALAGRPIAVRAPMRVVRGYVAIRELLSLVCTALLDERPSEPVLRFDSGGDPLELGELASEVAARLGGRVARASIERDDDNIYAGKRSDYDALLTKHGIVPVSLPHQIAETAAWMAGDIDIHV